MPLVRHKEICGKRRNVSGWSRGPKDPRDRPMAMGFLARMRMPDTFTLKGSSGLKVEDQENIGSCAANSSTTMAEYVLAKEGVDLQLSRLWLYARTRQFEGTPLTEDSGLFIRDVMKVLTKQGCPSESQYPYDLSKWTQDPPKELDEEALKHQLELYYKCSTLTAIKWSIAQGYPVVGGFDVPENMFSEECQRTGVVKYPSPKEGFEGGHAVLFIGYKPGWLEFLNSWSDGWGDGGHGFLDERFVTNGLADDFFTIRRVEK